MAPELASGAPPTGAMAPFAPGPLLRIAQGALVVDIVPRAGGRIAQIWHDGIEQLVGHGDDTSAMIAWGCYPMVPWAGRIRRGRFNFEGRSYRLPPNLGEHAIHGVGFAMPWRVDAYSPHHAELSLPLPEDERWPFGGISRQRLELGDNRLRMTLSVTAAARAMPATIGWHPWFRKPERIGFSPSRFYPRDQEGIAIHPLAEPPPGPWDDCFISDAPVLLHRAGRSVRLTSSCSHWVVYDEATHATCLEPQSGPPDAFNIEPGVLPAGASLEAWFLLEWS